MKTDKELADELDARDRLIARGYKLVKCDVCAGYGHLGSNMFTPICPTCNGRGQRWEAPITK